jgi:hypothetical protein
MDINKLSKEELDKLKLEIMKRENELKEEENNKKRYKAKLIAQSLINSNILNLIDHSRTSCSDENPSNGYESDRGYARCTKCHLMEILDDHEDGINDFLVSIDFSFDKID